jgi:hypothetical protein
MTNAQPQNSSKFSENIKKTFLLTLVYIFLVTSTFVSFPSKAVATDPLEPANEATDITAHPQDERLLAAFKQGHHATQEAFDDISNAVYNLPLEDLDIYHMGDQINSWDERTFGVIGKKKRRVVSMNQGMEGPFYRPPEVKDLRFAIHSGPDVLGIDDEGNKVVIKRAGDLIVSLDTDLRIVDRPHAKIFKKGISLPKDDTRGNPEKTIRGPYIAQFQVGKYVFLIPEKNRVMFRIGSPQTEHLIREIDVLDLEMACFGFQPPGKIPITSIPLEHGVERGLAKQNFSAVETNDGLFVKFLFGNNITKQIRHSFIRSRVETMKTNILMSVSAMTTNLRAFSGFREIVRNNLAMTQRLKANQRKDFNAHYELDALDHGLTGALRQNASPETALFDRFTERTGGQTMLDGRWISMMMPDTQDLTRRLDKEINSLKIPADALLPANATTFDPESGEPRISTAALYDSSSEHSSIMSDYAAGFGKKIKYVKDNPRVVLETIAGVSIPLIILGAASIFAYHQIYKSWDQTHVIEGGTITGFENAWNIMSSGVLWGMLFKIYLKSMFVFFSIFAVSNIIFKNKSLISLHGFSQFLFAIYDRLLNWAQRSTMMLSSLAFESEQRINGAWKSLTDPNQSTTWQRFLSLKRVTKPNELIQDELEFDRDVSDKIIALKEELTAREQEALKIQDPHLLAINHTQQKKIKNYLRQLANARVERFAPAAAQNRLGRASLDYLFIQVRTQLGDPQQEEVALGQILRKLLHEDGKTFTDTDDQIAKALAYWRASELEHALGFNRHDDLRRIEPTKRSTLDTEVSSVTNQIKNWGQASKSMIYDRLMPVRAMYYPESSLAAMMTLFIGAAFQLSLTLVGEITRRAQYLPGHNESLVGKGYKMVFDLELEMHTDMFLIPFLMYATYYMTNAKPVEFKYDLADKHSNKNYWRRLMHAFADSSTFFTEGGRRFYVFVVDMTIKYIFTRILILWGATTLMFLNSQKFLEASGGWEAFKLYGHHLDNSKAVLLLYLSVSGFMFSFCNQFFIKPFSVAQGNRIPKWWYAVIFYSLSGMATAYIGANNKVIAINKQAVPQEFHDWWRVFSNIQEWVGNMAPETWVNTTILLTLTYFTYPLYHPLLVKLKKAVIPSKKTTDLPKPDCS